MEVVFVFKGRDALGFRGFWVSRKNAEKLTDVLRLLTVLYQYTTYTREQKNMSRGEYLALKNLNVHLDVFYCKPSINLNTPIYAFLLQLAIRTVPKLSLNRYPTT